MNKPTRIKYRMPLPAMSRTSARFETRTEELHPEWTIEDIQQWQNILKAEFHADRFSYWYGDLGPCELNTNPATA